MKKPRRVKPPKEKKPTELPAPEKDDEKVDYGGIPSRDLKKNLGCG